MRPRSFRCAARNFRDLKFPLRRITYKYIILRESPGRVGQLKKVPCVSTALLIPQKKKEKEGADNLRTISFRGSRDPTCALYIRQTHQPTEVSSVRAVKPASNATSCRKETQRCSKHIRITSSTCKEKAKLVLKGCARAPATSSA